MKNYRRTRLADGEPGLPTGEVTYARLKRLAGMLLTYELKFRPFAKAINAVAPIAKEDPSVWQPGEAEELSERVEECMEEIDNQLLKLKRVLREFGIV